MGYFNKSRAGHRSAKNGHSCRDYLDQCIRIGDAAGKAGERTNNLQLIWSLMQRAASLAQHRRGDVGTDKKNGDIVLQTFQQRNQRKQVSRTSRGKDSGYLAATAIEAVRCIARRLLVTNYPMVKFWRLPQRFIDSNIVNAGNAETDSDAMLHQGGDNGLRAGHRSQMGRGWGSNRHWC